MVPPWHKYPAIPLGSLAWRMGHGEEYWIEFINWFAGQLPEAQRDYASSYPEPAGWKGFYARQGVTL